MSSKASCMLNLCFKICSCCSICYFKFSFFSFSTRIYCCCWAILKWLCNSSSFSISWSRDYWRLCCFSSNSLSSLNCSCSLWYSYSASYSLWCRDYEEPLSVKEWCFCLWWPWSFLLCEVCFLGCSSLGRISFYQWACLISSSTSHSYGSCLAFCAHFCFSKSSSPLLSSESKASYWSASSTDFIAFNLAFPIAIQFATCNFWAYAWRSVIVGLSSNRLSPKCTSLDFYLTWTTDI